MDTRDHDATSLLTSCGWEDEKKDIESQKQGKKEYCTKKGKER